MLITFCNWNYITKKKVKEITDLLLGVNITVEETVVVDIEIPSTYFGPYYLCNIEGD